MAIKTRFLKKEHIDSGLALLLLTLLAGWLFNLPYALQIAICEVLVILIAPVLIYPFTFLWLNLSNILGWIMSKVILSLIFFVIVCPVAIIRKAMGKDTLLLKKFKKENNSVFTDRNQAFGKSDFTTQY
jgi:hypothetical protein